MTDINGTDEPKKRDGHGGVRKGAGRPITQAKCLWEVEGISRSTYYLQRGFGGPQPGSGRPRKIIQPVPSKTFAVHEGKNTPRGPIVRKVVVTPAGKQNQGITTGGSLSQFERAWVYVGVRKSDGLVKIGMSGNVPQRCRQLGISQFFAHPVMPGLAKLLESMALRRLGVLKSGSEWIFCKPEAAATAVVAARAELSRLCHADPDETPGEAYSRRKEMAA